MTNGILNSDLELEKIEYINEVKQDCFKGISVEKINKGVVDELRSLYFMGAIPNNCETTLEILLPITMKNSVTIEIFNDKDFLEKLKEYLKDGEGELLLSGNDNVLEHSYNFVSVENYYHLRVTYILKNCGESFLF